MQATLQDLSAAIDPSWQKPLKEEFDKEYMHTLANFVKEERKRFEIYPPAKDVFNAFRYAKFEETRVVIMGQDPYHGPNQAHGLCFSVKKGITPPPSLKNIYKELYDDLGITAPLHGYLVDWAKQGVLLLNATLTVQRSNPKSHYGKGWEVFTDKVVEVLAKRDEPIVFVLWGKSAYEKCEHIVEQNEKHLIISAPHPSPYSANSGFFGSKPFSKINSFLQKHGKKPIDWRMNEGK